MNTMTVHVGGYEFKISLKKGVDVNVELREYMELYRWVHWLESGDLAPNYIEAMEAYERYNKAKTAPE